MKFMEDYDLELRLSLEGPWAFIREPLAINNVTFPDSLSRKVSKEVVCLEQYVLRSRERVLATLRSRSRPTTTLWYLKQAIKKARRDLWVARLRESNFWGTRLVAGFLQGLERYRMGLFRRSPSFPKVEAVPIEWQEESRSTTIAYGRAQSGSSAQSESMHIRDTSDQARFP
jgi:hypothetical protein